MSLMRKLLALAMKEPLKRALLQHRWLRVPGATDRPVRSRWEIARRRFTGSISTGSWALWISAAMRNNRVLVRG